MSCTPSLMQNDEKKKESSKTTFCPAVTDPIRNKAYREMCGPSREMYPILQEKENYEPKILCNQIVKTFGPAYDPTKALLGESQTVSVANRGTCCSGRGHKSPPTLICVDSEVNLTHGTHQNLCESS